MNGLTLKQISKILRYEPDTGLFHWVQPGIGRQLERPAGSLRPTGYIGIWFNKHNCQAHRLAWLFITGRSPKNEIDHINGIRSDNRAINLRIASRAKNSYNKLPVANKAGFKGVIKLIGNRKNPWQATIQFRGERKYLGNFDCPGCAAIAYDNAAKRYFGGFARPNFYSLQTN